MKEEGKAHPAPEPATTEQVASPPDAWTADRLRRGSLPPEAGTLPFRPERTSRIPALPAAPSDAEDGDALSLVARSEPWPAPDLESDMGERFALGDYTGCLRAAHLLLGRDRSHAAAAHYARESEARLESIFVSRLTAHGRVPVLAVCESDLPWCGVDPRGTQLLARLDGRADLDEIISLSGMTRLDALRLLAELLEHGIIRLV